MLPYPTSTLAVLVFTVAVLAIVTLLVIWGYSANLRARRMNEVFAAACTIRSATRTYLATHGGKFPATPLTMADLGFGPNDLDGRFYTQTDFKFAPVPGSDVFTVTYTPSAAARELGMQEFVLDGKDAPADTSNWPCGN